MDPEAATALQGQFQQGLRINHQNNMVDTERMMGKINASKLAGEQVARAGAGYQTAQTGLQGQADSNSREARRREVLLALFGQLG
jgi:hypothetical protein